MFTSQYSWFGVRCSACVHAASVIDINDGNRSGEEQERTVVDRILTMFKTLTWQEMSR